MVAAHLASGEPMTGTFYSGSQNQPSGITDHGFVDLEQQSTNNRCQDYADIQDLESENDEDAQRICQGFKWADEVSVGRTIYLTTMYQYYY